MKLTEENQDEMDCRVPRLVEGMNIPEHLRRGKAADGRPEVQGSTARRAKPSKRLLMLEE
jgi:hypothetical protein